MTSAATRRHGPSAYISPGTRDRDGDLLPGRTILKRDGPDFAASKKDGADREGTVECGAPPALQPVACGGPGGRPVGPCRQRIRARAEKPPRYDRENRRACAPDPRSYWDG